MNHKQKLGYMALGAGILALGIIIGQWGTPDIEAQSNGVFDTITCRELEVVDQDGNKAIVLQSNENVNLVIVYEPQNKRANVVGIKMTTDHLTNQIKIGDAMHEQTAIWLYSTEASLFAPVNKVKVNRPAGGRGVALSTTYRDSSFSIDGGNIFLQSGDKHNLMLLMDVENRVQEAFEIVSRDGGNFASRWIRERDRRENW